MEPELKLSAYAKARTACSYFFAGSGLAYGMLTSRMPALAMQTGANEAEIGLLLLCLGVTGMAALAVRAWILDRFSSRRLLLVSTPLLCLALPLAGLAASPIQLGLVCITIGISIGFMDVSMNTQAIQIEKQFSRPCVSSMHASYSIGGIAGSAAGALFAGCGSSTLVNFLCVMGLYFCFYPLACPHMPADAPVKNEGGVTPSFRIPIFVLICGALATAAYSAEGSVAEWGSLLLFTAKGAGESASALVFGVFCTAMVAGRLAGDRLRHDFGDFTLLFLGSCLAAAGMIIVLVSPWAAICLSGYAAMGLGLAPLVPIFFSRAGSIQGISTGKACAIVSFMGYSGVLVFPPSLGWLAHSFGLDAALTIIPVLCFVLALGSFFFRGDPKKTALRP